MCDTSAPPGSSPNMSAATLKYASPGMTSIFLPCRFEWFVVTPFRPAWLVNGEVGAEAGIGKSEYSALCGVEVALHRASVFVTGRIRSFTKAGVADGVLNADPDVFFASVTTPVLKTENSNDRKNRQRHPQRKHDQKDVEHIYS